MSGGVDSTATALLLQEKYHVHGFFMQLAQSDLEAQVQRVTEIAARCKVPLTIIDLRPRFEEKVLSYFSHSYQEGRTPNPCMICNREIKFGLFMDAILEHGMTRMATGHYANIISKNACLYLEQGTDDRKDQSYFLARLDQKQLARVDFPLAKMNKSQTYDFVESRGFFDFRGRESQDVCFLGHESVGRFLESRDDWNETRSPGEIVHSDGRILGHHNGIHNYTIGQRRGLGIAAPAPLYVVDIEASLNRIVVGGNEELYQGYIEIKNVLWNCGRSPRSDQDYRVRIRYGQKGQLARIERITDAHYGIQFTEKQRAVTPGQFAVIYDENLVIGSGEIQ